MPTKIDVPHRALIDGEAIFDVIDEHPVGCRFDVGDVDPRKNWFRDQMPVRYGSAASGSSHEVKPPEFGSADRQLSATRLLKPTGRNAQARPAGQRISLIDRTAGFGISGNSAERRQLGRVAAGHQALEVGIGILLHLVA